MTGRFYLSVLNRDIFDSGLGSCTVKDESVPDEEIKHVLQIGSGPNAIRLSSSVLSLVVGFRWCTYGGTVNLTNYALPFRHYVLIRLGTPPLRWAYLVYPTRDFPGVAG